MIRQASIDLRQRVSPSLDIVYACIGDFVDRVRLGLSTVGAAFPILAVHDREIAPQTLAAAEPLRSIFTSPVQRFPTTNR